MVKPERKRIRLVRSILSKQQNERRSRRHQSKWQKHLDPSRGIAAPEQLPLIAVSFFAGMESAQMSAEAIPGK